MLDADETLTAALATELDALAPAADVDAFAVPRTTYLCGAAIRHGPWGGDAPVRLFRTEPGRRSSREPAAGGDADLHERWTVPGRVERTRGSLDHDSYPTLASYRRKFARYTSLEAEGVRTSFGGSRARVRDPHRSACRGICSRRAAGATAGAERSSRRRRPRIRRPSHGKPGVAREAARRRARSAAHAAHVDRHARLRRRTRDSTAARRPGSVVRDARADERARRRRNRSACRSRSRVCVRASRIFFPSTRRSPRPAPFAITVHDLIHLRYPRLFKRSVGPVLCDDGARGVRARAARHHG